MWYSIMSHFLIKASYASSWTMLKMVLFKHDNALKDILI